MNEAITARAWFGDGEHTFTLTDDMIAELERMTGKGIAAIHRQLIELEFSNALLRDIIRLGLIGAGMKPERAAQICAVYAVNRPMAETFPLAFEIVEARWNGTEGGETAEEVSRNVDADWQRFAAAQAAETAA